MIIGACQAAGYDLVILETPGIGQGDAAVVPLADVSLYVMTPEFGAASQLEKIDMLDFADAVAINKFERRGAADALRDVSRQLIRNREAFGARPEDMPVFGTSAAMFNDNGVTALYQYLTGLLAACGLPLAEGVLPAASGRTSVDATSVIPPSQTGYLAGVAATVRGYHAETARQAEAVRRVQRLTAVRHELTGEPAAAVAALLQQAEADVTDESRELVEGWRTVVEAYSGDVRVVRIRDRELETWLTRKSLSGNTIPRVALPWYTDHGELLRFLREENLPGYFPFTAGGSRSSGKRRIRHGCSPERGSVPDQPAVQAAVGRERGDPAVHRVRLGHPVRSRSGGEPGRVRQGRHLGRVHGDAGGYEGPLRRVRPNRAHHVGFDDDQRARANDPGVFPQHRHRPAA